MVAWRSTKFLFSWWKKYFTHSLRSLVKYCSTLEEKLHIPARPCNILYLCCFWKINYLIYPWYMDWLAHHLSDAWFNKWYLLSFCHTKELLKVFTVPQRWLGYQALKSVQLFTINMTSYVTIYQGAKKVCFTACPKSQQVPVSF